MSAQRSSFLTAEWRWLAMLNYEIDPQILLPFVPVGTELDAWQERTFVSVVGFRFLNTRLKGWSIPLHSNFDEINLRFYVRRKWDGEERRGVVFIRELVPRRAIAWTARLFYNENYSAVPMSHLIDEGQEGVSPKVSYQWRYRRSVHQLHIETDGLSAPVQKGSEEEFITEHYWGYARQRDGGTVEYEVEHPRWNVWPASKAVLHADTATLYGPAFAPILASQPSSAFLADGSAVAVHRGRRLPV